MLDHQTKQQTFLSIARFLLCVLLIVGSPCIEAKADKPPYQPKPVRYKLIHLGATTLGKDLLTRSAWPLTLAPRINNKGEVICNSKETGFVWTYHNGFKTYVHEGVSSYFVDINDGGAVLGFADLLDAGREWFIWSECCGMREDLPAFINPGCVKGKDLYFRSISNHAVLVGSRFIEGCFRSVFWESKNGLKDLNYGKLWDVNNRDYMLGSEDFKRSKEPYLWHVRGGSVVLSDDIKLRRPEKESVFVDYAIAPDNVIYGTYHDLAGGYGALLTFYWDPCEQIFHTLFMNQMRISAVNRCHTLVGSLCGVAAISFKHQQPIPLAVLVEGNLSGWNLIEATDINDIGQIVGYGTYGDEIHLFMLQPLF